MQACGLLVLSSVARKWGLSEQEFMALSDEEQQSVMAKTKRIFEETGAHYTIQTMKALPTLIEQINERLTKETVLA